jgi:hypothetical protein
VGQLEVLPMRVHSRLLLLEVMTRKKIYQMMPMMKSHLDCCQTEKALIERPFLSSLCWVDSRDSAVVVIADVDVAKGKSLWVVRMMIAPR